MRYEELTIEGRNAVIEAFRSGKTIDKVFILYGLRRTGKTTLIKQLIYDMDESIFSKTAFMKMDSSINLAKINIDLNSCW